MTTYSFKDDYSEGAHENIIRRLASTNRQHAEGYAEDHFCMEASELLRNKMQKPDADIHFVSGGTQANSIVISTMLKPFESVISASTGHIEIHEAGAIEATGHKINTIDSKDGKLNIDLIDKVLTKHTDEHMVKPKAVYISNTTELGTVYTKNEIIEISKFCKSKNLYFYLDGARLGAALTSVKNDMSLSDIAEWVDVFYLGGTKNGALLGEAIIILNDQLKEGFRYAMKQKGALLAKGRIFGIQFLELFTNDLYFTLAQHANMMAQKLANGIVESGCKLFLQQESNQVFAILPNTTIQLLKQNFSFYIWDEFDENSSIIRLVTSWATEEEKIQRFIDQLKSI